jgi:heptosyltransferase-2
MVMAQSLFMTLCRSTGAEVDVLAPAWSMPLIGRMPEVKDAIEMPLGHGEFGWFVRRRLGIGLRRRDYARAIVLPRSAKSALVPWHARIPVRTGYLGEMRVGLLNDIRRLDADVLTQAAQRYVALGHPADSSQPPSVPAPRLRVDSENQSRLMSRLGLADEGPVVAMMPGAEYGPAKCWPLLSFAETARGLADLGYRVWVLGSAGDRRAGDEIERHSRGAASNLCGETRLADAVDLLARARYAITNDSGLLHVSAAVGCHVIGIYGSSTPAYTPPLTERRSIHYLGLECSPCFSRHCPLGHLRCLREIQPQVVLETVQAADDAGLFPDLQGAGGVCPVDAS